MNELKNTDKILEISIKIYNEDNRKNFDGWVLKDRYTVEYINDGMPNIKRRITLMIGKLFSTLFLKRNEIIEKIKDE